jgi:hypothetical protein
MHVKLQIVFYCDKFLKYVYLSSSATCLSVSDSHPEAAHSVRL